jgi:trehalose-6-phosphate synthase
MAADLERALSMPIEERRERHRSSLAAVVANPSTRWAGSFLAALVAAHRQRGTSLDRWRRVDGA